VISVQTTGLDQAIANLKKKSAALHNLEPAYKRFAAEIVKKTDDSFQDSRGYDGEPWPPLAESTIERRIGSLKSANKRGKSGKLTKGATKMRDKMRAPGGIKPMIDTGRARNSQHADTSRDGVEWSAVGYLGYHMTNHIVATVRNPTPFYWDGSAWKLRDSAMKSLGTHLRTHIFGSST
jgi:hypothetical protein